ncbi:hypothetical protein HanXRQr2_Chr01g0043101 [Helianthus annuus]|uniref:Uncharacterized protein n=1 Tax=Helianthus annuus TaxID=4232 RepID=A0A9K3P412_HELAN|nr:hypothetical protein HanXRQr2_Chr01g0043101 [Helianthus annuus]KAJ0958789.1 hypothetical protein HanPSC8_Chr01g0042761 [Helianthus annuus]
MNKLKDAAGISNLEVIFRFIFSASSVGNFCNTFTNSRMPDDQIGIIRIRDLRDSTFSTVVIPHGFEPEEPMSTSLTTHALLRNLKYKFR